MYQVIVDSIVEEKAKETAQYYRDQCASVKKKNFEITVQWEIFKGINLSKWIYKAYLPSKIYAELYTYVALKKNLHIDHTLVSFMAKILLTPWSIWLCTSKKCSGLTVDFRRYFELTIDFRFDRGRRSTDSAYLHDIPLITRFVLVKYSRAFIMR